MTDPVQYNRDRITDTQTVRAIQTLVGAQPDGVWGPQTVARVRAWQSRHALAPDGLVGRGTLTAMERQGLEVHQLDIMRPALPRMTLEVPGRQWLIDVSQHQGAIDWPEVAGAGVSAAIVKAGDGARTQDPAFERNWRGARCAGIPRGCYHFALLEWRGELTSARRHVENLARILGDDPGELPWAIDYETRILDAGIAAGGRQYVADWMIEAAEVVRELSGRPSVIYCAHWAMRRLGSLIDDLKREYLWYARYPQEIDYSAPEPPDHPPGWPWDIWQVTGSGACAGISGDVDINILNPNSTLLQAAKETS